MATTEKGIYYPNEYSSVADVPADMKKMAESIDNAIGNIPQYDDTEIKQDITDLQYENETQAEEIQKLKDNNNIKIETKEATSLHVEDASAFPARLNIYGNHEQEISDNSPSIDYPSTVKTVTSIIIEIESDNNQKQNYTLSVQEPMLKGDCFKKETNNWKEIHNWKRLIITGNENITLVNTVNNISKFELSDVNDANFESESITICSNCFKGVENSLIVNNSITVSEKNKISFLTSEYATVETFKQMLAEKNNNGRPVIVYYQVIPYEVDCTEVQVEVLEQLQHLSLFEGKNNITTTRKLALLKLIYTVNTQSYIDEAIKDLDTNKVDKEDGKGLSTNDFTNEDKEKLDGLENYDDTEIKQDIEDIQAKDEAQDTEIDKQSDLIQKLKDNCINVTTEEATSLQVTDASTLAARLEVRGNHSQETREGYNLWDYLNVVKASAGGLTIEKDYENGYITVNGTPNENYVYISSSIFITDMLEDGQRYTLWQEIYGGEGTTDGIYLQVTRTADNETTVRYYSRNNSASFLVDKSNNASYSIILQTSSVDGTGTLTNYKNRYMLYKGTDEKTYELPGASPSLDYPSEVEAVGDNGSVEIKKLTENVINLSKSVALYNTEITEIDEENGIIKVHRTNTQDPSIQIFCNLPAGQYTMLHNSHNFGQVSVYGKNKIVDIGSEKYKIFNATENITDIRIYSGSELPTDYEINFSDIILVMGNVAREDIKYVKYQESNYILDIQKPMLQGDYFVKETDGWKEVHTFGYVNTREVENLGVSLNTSNGEFRRYNAHNLVTDRKSGEYLKILCTHFKRTDSRWHENEGICGWETGQSFCIGTFNTNYDTADKMKTFLQNNDVGIYYELATPTKLPCTEAQSNVLDQLNELELYKGTNNIITAESLALMQMQYIADTETYIDNRIDEKLANINQQLLEIVGGN